MGTCYNILFNESTSAFYKHGTSVTATGEHDCGYYVNNDPTINSSLNTQADAAVTSADSIYTVNVTSANESTSGIPQFSSPTYGGTMKIELVISLKTPIIKAGYNPNPRTKPTDVVKR